MSRYNPTLLTPPKEEEVIYPYRRVWYSITFEVGILILIAVSFFIIFDVLTISLPEIFNRVIIILLALAPTLLWLVFSLYREYRVQEPRPQLALVFIISILAANAVGVPLLDNFLHVDDWLALEDTLDRIIGYTVTVGIVQEGIKYTILRYIIWPQHLRTRLDSVAYAVATAIGYATVLNLHFIAEGATSPSIVVYRVLFNVAIHITASVIMSYGLAELHFSPRNLFLLPTTLALAALSTGVAIPIRAGIVNAGFSLGFGVQNQLFGLLFSIGLIIVPMIAMILLYENAENRQREAFNVAQQE